MTLLRRACVSSILLSVAAPSTWTNGILNPLRSCRDSRPFMTGCGRIPSCIRRFASALPREAADLKPFKPEYRGQITPTRQRFPQEDALPAVHLQAGPYSSRWLRVHGKAEVDDVVKALEQAEVGATAGIFVGISDEHKNAGPIAAALRRLGFRFHYMVENNEGDTDLIGELIYCRWAGSGPNMVPSYSTALEGVGILVLSPDKSSVLLVWEYNSWKMITGNVDAGESIVTAARREVHEEVGIEVNDDMTMVGGWQDAKARDQTINNIFCVFAATASSLKAKVDGVEIVEACWFPISALPSLTDESEISATQVRDNPFAIEWDVGKPSRNRISRAVVKFLDVHKQGRGLKVMPKNGSCPWSRKDFFI
eukprot:TRINITY_DN5538_c1_g1_i1.p1 TRINITY_DN5538_c1_g1~~TRINITY_DN5538_c1_g1_i1.p1  ORF type:complete len:374 (+),score=73.66 TRINITY_DN5538_c1_g1_i1:24-1124(+)